MIYFLIAENMSKKERDDLDDKLSEKRKRPASLRLSGDVRKV